MTTKRKIGVIRTVVGAALIGLTAVLMHLRGTRSLATDLSPLLFGSIAAVIGGIGVVVMIFGLEDLLFPSRSNDAQ